MALIKSLIRGKTGGEEQICRPTEGEIESEDGSK